jgi:serine protease Do
MFRRVLAASAAPARLLSLLILVALALTLVPQRAKADDDADEDWQAEAREKQFASLSHDVAELEKLSNVMKKVVRLVRPTVVHIEAKKIDADKAKIGRRGDIEEAGSGFIIQQGPNYYVLTNCHVVRQAQLRDIKIRLADGRQLTPLQKWEDAETDVAVMSVAAPNLVASRLANSDQVEIGDFVLAVGSPFGLSHSTTFGIISAEGRRDLDLGSDVKYQDFLQTDAAINPGNSGGPLINLRGEVIGMNTAIASSSGANEGIGFTIPINMVKVISHQLVEHGHVTRGRLGITLDDKFGAGSTTNVGLQLPRGARIREIQAGTPAEAAKLQVGDIVLKFDGIRVENYKHFKSLVSLTDIGRDVPLVINRNGETLNLSVLIGAEASARAATPHKK